MVSDFIFIYIFGSHLSFFFFNCPFICPCVIVLVNFIFVKHFKLQLLQIKSIFVITSYSYNYQKQTLRSAAPDTQPLFNRF